MNAFKTETVNTPAGEYVIELHTDEDAANPLTDWDHPGMGFWVNYDSTRLIETDTLDSLTDATKPRRIPARDAGGALREFVHLDSDQDAVVNRFNKWRAITGSPWMLVAGEDSSSRSDFYRWFVLIDTSQTWTDSAGKTQSTFLHPDKAARGAMNDYRTWAAGEVCGFVVNGSDGDEVESCWGFYDDDDALSEARAVVAADVPQRVAAANLVGSGFVGVL